MSDTIPTPESEPKAEKFWEVNFTFVSRRECRAIVKAETKAQAEAIIESLSSDVLEYGLGGSDIDTFNESPYCEYEEETVEDFAAYGPLYKEDL